MTVRDVISEITGKRIVLPVIQRRLEWPEYKMEMLFDSLFKQNSFGSIICIEEEKDSSPLFAHRLFTIDGSNMSSCEVGKISDTLLLIIDGQQRLQSFYMGLCGTYNGKTMYYDLFSSYKSYDYEFRFASSEKELPAKNSDRTELNECLWYSVPRLFSDLKDLSNTDVWAEKISAERGITDTIRQKYIEKNIEVFYARIFGDQSIGISKVTARMSDNISEDRQRVTELFRRLNFEGMKLSIYDLVASQLKSFDYKMEDFLDEVTEENSDIGIDQDALIRLLLILHDKPKNGTTELTADDAKFAADNGLRIKKTLEALKKFLAMSHNYEWFDTSKKSPIHKSAIPLYCLAYYIFHRSCPDDEIACLFDRYETDENSHSMALWLELSLINQLFRKGCGWQAEKTGIRKIHEILSKNKGKDFPISELFRAYRKYPLKFADASEITPQTIDSLDQEYIFYLIYGGVRSSIRTEDKDHIQPQALLEDKRISARKINSIGNLILIDYRTNRGRKNDKELKDWIVSLPNRQEYMKRHLIPDMPELWRLERFDDFLNARLQLITDKIKSSL